MRSFLTKKSITRTILMGAVSMALVLPMSPAHAAAAATGIARPDDGTPWFASGVCVAESVGTDGRTMRLVVEGQATSQGPAIDTGLVCHVYVNGSHVGSVGGTGIGPAAAAAGVVGPVPIGPYDLCAEVWSVYPTGSAHSTC